MTSQLTLRDRARRHNRQAATKQVDVRHHIAHQDGSLCKSLGCKMGHGDLSGRQT